MNDGTRDNNCFFSSLRHSTSGNELPVSLLVQGAYIETLELDSPKLVLEFRDHESYLKGQCRVKEKDELEVELSDGSVSESRSFTVLAVSDVGEKIRLECIATPTYNLKKIADKTKIFSMRGISQIIQIVCQGLVPSLGAFAISNSYHVLAGERPSTMLRQIGKEQGAEVWTARGRLNIEKFSKLFAASPKFEFHHGQTGERNILGFKVPSGQRDKEERTARTFTGWDEKDGRIKTASGNPILKAAASKPVEITGGSSKYSLNTATVARKSVVAFTTEGDLSIQPGDALSLVWHLPSPEEPLDEGMPAKVVASSVTHWYGSHLFYTKIVGDVAFSVGG